MTRIPFDLLSNLENSIQKVKSRNRKKYILQEITKSEYSDKCFKISKFKEGRTKTLMNSTK